MQKRVGQAWRLFVEHRSCEPEDDPVKAQTAVVPVRPRDFHPHSAGDRGKGLLGSGTGGEETSKFPGKVEWGLIAHLTCAHVLPERAVQSVPMLTPRSFDQAVRLRSRFRISLTKSSVSFA